jgi:hypothetical protein
MPAYVPDKGDFITLSFVSFRCCEYVVAVLPGEGEQTK